MSNWTRALRNLRQFHGMKQSAISELLNVTQATVSRWETGKQVPDLSAQRRIRDLLHKFSTRIDVDAGALMASPVADRSLLDFDFVIAGVSECGLKSIGANASDMIGTYAQAHRQDAEYERLLNDYRAILRRGEFISAEGLFFSKRARSWIATYAVPVLIGVQLYLLSDRRLVADQCDLKSSFSIRLME